MDYKKILEGVVNIINTAEKSDIGFANICTYIGEKCPELKESEDEKTRKRIIALVNAHGQGMYKGEMLAWLENIPYTIDHEKREGFHLGYKAGLEKQGNSPIKWNKNTEDCKPKVNHSVLMKTTHSIAEGEWKGEYWEQYRWAGIVRDSDVLSWIEFSDLEKQGEQKPTDKVEPKFKVGDWCIDNEDGTIFQIVKVFNDTYNYKTNEGKKYCCSHYSLENDARLWTIQDAKDGDVLATEDNCICIFDNTVEEGKYPFAYCGLSMYGFKVYDRTLPFTHDNVYPATKEQRDLLFQKMKEAGYEWDGDKKELKKIEQKTAWGEDDEKMIGRIRGIVEAYAFSQSAVDVNGDLCEIKFIDVDIWLKSLKQKIGGKL